MLPDGGLIGGENRWRNKPAGRLSPCLIINRAAIHFNVIVGSV
jgi:hypothetical protein